MTTSRTSPTDNQDDQPPAPGGQRAQGKLSDHLANQRTLLAWARTGVSIMALGFVVARFGLLIRELSVAHAQATSHALPTGVADGFGIALILFGAALVGLSLARYLRIARGIDEGATRGKPPRDLGIAAGRGRAGRRKGGGLRGAPSPRWGGGIPAGARGGPPRLDIVMAAGLILAGLILAVYLAITG